MSLDNGKEWSREEIVTLIKGFECRPALWDTDCVDYKDRNRKRTALTEVANRLGRTAEETNKKWHILRTQMLAEVKKMKAKNVGVLSCYEPKWTYYKYLKFIDTSSADRTDSMIESTQVSSTSIRNISQSADAITPSRLNQTDLSSQKALPKSTKRKKDEELSFESSKIMNERSDHHRIFGDYVASVLKKLKTEPSKNKLRRIIQKAILEIEEEDETNSLGDQ